MPWKERGHDVPSCSVRPNVGDELTDEAIPQADELTSCLAPLAQLLPLPKSDRIRVWTLQWPSTPQYAPALQPREVYPPEHISGHHDRLARSQKLIRRRIRLHP